MCIGMWVIYALVTGGTGAGGSSENSEMDGVFALLALAGIAVFACIGLVVGGAIRGGYDLAMVRHSQGDTALEFGDMFAGFSKFGSLFIVNVLFSIALFGGVCLLIIPGVVVAITLWPVFLLVMEDDLPPVDALKAAWALTSPHIGALFILALASCAINILGLLACCVGLLVTGPVTQLAWATAYRELRGS